MIRRRVARRIAGVLLLAPLLVCYLVTAISTDPVTVLDAAMTALVSVVPAIVGLHLLIDK